MRGRATGPTCRRRVRSPARIVLIFLATHLVHTVSSAGAQQFVTDDAAVVERGACQIEGWFGASAAWVLPACRFFPVGEVTLGIGRVAQEDGGRRLQYVLQTKALILPPRPNRVGWGLVAGVGVDRLDQILGRPVTSAYVYAPVSLALARERVVLHQNLGWRLVRGDSEGERRFAQAITWAVRADLVVAERLTILGELFGEDLTAPQYQAGVRVTVIPSRVLADLSFGGHTAPGQPGAGFSLGIACTPPPLRPDGSR